MVVTLATVWGVAMGVVIIMQRRPAGANIAWLLVLIWLPMVGRLVYRFIGPRRYERGKTERRRTHQLVLEALGALRQIQSESVNLAVADLAKVGISVGEAPPLRA